MSVATESFLDQLEAAATSAVIGTKKVAKALAPPEFKTPQQDKLGDMKAYKRRQKKMEKGLLNQEVEIDEEDYPTAMKRYPMQLDKEEDDGEWITGDPDLPINWEFKGDPLKKAYKQVKKDRATVTKKGDTTVKGALGELASLFQGITGQELEEEVEEVKAIDPMLLSEPEPIVPYIDPRIIEEATNELQSLFSDMSGIELFGERLEEEEVIEIPVTPPETFDISEVSSITTQIFGGHHKALDTTLYDPTNFKHTQVVKDVDDLLEKHKEDLPEEQYQILKTDAADKTADYLSKLNLKEFEVPNSMPLTGANMPLVSSPQFTMAVSGILRKMMATGPGTGVVDLNKLDDVDNDTAYPSGAIVDGMVLAYRPDTAPLNRPYKWQAADTPPVGDIHGIVTAANSGLEGGANSGVVTLTVDASNLPALGTQVALTDYVVIYDADASATKKVLVSNFSSGDITGVTAGTGLSGGGQSGAVTLNVEASQTQITSIGTIGTGTWQGTAIANGYLGTGINANKLANGSVTNTELQYINSLSSNAQTQITNVKTTADAAASKAFAIAQAVALG